MWNQEGNDAFLSSFTIKEIMFWVSRNHVQWGKNAKIFKNAYGQAITSIEEPLGHIWPGMCGITNIRPLQLVFKLFTPIFLWSVPWCRQIHPGSWKPYTKAISAFLSSCLKQVSVSQNKNVHPPKMLFKLFASTLGVTVSSNLDVFLKKVRRGGGEGGGHFRSKKLHCRIFWFQSGIFWS